MPLLLQFRKRANAVVFLGVEIGKSRCVRDPPNGGSGAGSKGDAERWRGQPNATTAGEVPIRGQRTCMQLPPRLCPHLSESYSRAIEARSPSWRSSNALKGKVPLSEPRS